MTTNLTALYGLKQSGVWKSQTFTTSGTWLKPANVNMIKVILVGGGGGGINNTTNYTKADDGQSSIFNTSPFTLTARGGQGGSTYITVNDKYAPRYGGGCGGGAESFIRTIYYQDTNTNTNFIRNIQGNGGRRIFPIPESGSGPTSYELYNGYTGIAAGDSITGGGGAAYYNNTGVSIFGSASFGGNVPGFGSGGIYGGGGGSFGNGGNGRYTDTITGQTFSATPGQYGGGGAGGGTYGAGGGGGEILIREIPITTDAVITIGTGGTGNGTNTSAGGNGLCIIYWFE